MRQRGRGESGVRRWRGSSILKEPQLLSDSYRRLARSQRPGDWAGAATPSLPQVARGCLPLRSGKPVREAKRTTLSRSQPQAPGSPSLNRLLAPAWGWSTACAPRPRTGAAR